MMEQQERARLRHLEAIFESASIGIVTMTEDGVIQDANPAACRLFGYQLGELRGGPVTQLMWEREAAAHHHYVSRYLETGVGRMIRNGRSLVGRHKNGSRVPVFLHVTEAHVDGQRLFTGMLQDESAAAVLDARLREAQKLEAVGRLAEGVAHEFNNALHGIRIMSELLLSELPSDETTQSWGQQMRESVERAGEICRRLRQSSIEQRELSFEAFDVNDRLRALEGGFRRLLPHDIELELDLDGGPVSIMADPILFERALLDLLLNARDAVRRHGTVVRLQTRAGHQPESFPALPSLPVGVYHRLSVVDDGAGMDARARERALEPFYTTKPATAAHGLGLSMVYGALRSCNGNIEIESTVGAGTRVTTVWPGA